jgi:hypothetical protein
MKMRDCSRLCLISLIAVFSATSEATTFRHFARCNTIFENRHTGPSPLTADFYEELNDAGDFTGNGYQHNQNSMLEFVSVAGNSIGVNDLYRNRLEISYKPDGVRSIRSFASLDPDTIFLEFDMPGTRMSEVEMRTGSRFIWGTFQCVLLTDCSSFLANSSNPSIKH